MRIITFRCSTEMVRFIQNEKDVRQCKSIADTIRDILDESIDESQESPEKFLSMLVGAKANTRKSERVSFTIDEYLYEALTELSSENRLTVGENMRITIAMAMERKNAI